MLDRLLWTSTKRCLVSLSLLSSKMTLRRRLDHRQHGNRIVLEVLLWGHTQHTCPEDADQKEYVIDRCALADHSSLF